MRAVARVAAAENERRKRVMSTSHHRPNVRSAVDKLNPEDERLSGCAGKKGHLTWTEADKALKRQRRKHTLKGAVTIYRCRTCGLFHYGGEARFSHA